MKACIAILCLGILQSCVIAADNWTENALLYHHTDFSRLEPGNFGELAGPGFPEYHHVPRKFTDEWNIVNNRGPEKWKALEIDGHRTLNYLGYNSSVWTKDFTYPMICTGDSLWSNYSVEVQITPLSRTDVADWRGVLFRYQDGRYYYFFGFGKGREIILQYRDGEKGFREEGWHVLGSREHSIPAEQTCHLRVEAYGSRITCRVNRETVFTVSDKRYPSGKVGLLACSPVRFHEVSVRTTGAEETAYLEQKGQQEIDLAKLRAQNPRPVLWKRLYTSGFGAARALRLGDLDGGRLDLLLVQSIPY